MAAVNTNERSGTIELGNFRLLGLLGEGAFASAYLAEQLGTERRAVVKIAHRHLMLKTDLAVIKARFLDEVRASTRVQHPSLATVFTAGETIDGLPAIAMEFVPGDSLEACLERSAPLNPSELVYFEQLASVLATLHHADVIHRDVSPSNVMITRDHSGGYRAMLVDFGIAQLKDNSNATGAMGTPRYSPPEQINGNTVPASDIHGLGAMLWWALTGRPYLDTLKSIEALVAHQLRMTAAPDPRSVNPHVAPSFAELVVELLDPNPNKRPTASALLARWPSVAQEARRWRRQNRRPKSRVMATVTSRRRLRLLVVDPQPVKRHLVGGFTERLGCEVTFAEDPRDATRGLLGTFDIAIMATELGGVNAGAVAKHLREHFPEQRLVLMSSHGERIINCSECDADLHLSLPGELGKLAEYLETFRQRLDANDTIQTVDPHAPVSSTIIESWKSQPEGALQRAIGKFIGVMPTMITQLDGIEAATPEVLQACETIEEQATPIGALHLARLATSLRMLLEANELPNPEAFVAELESEYLRVFRELRHLIQEK